MLQRYFKQFFLENILDFLWRQWSALGIAGGAHAEESWAIDPEALLPFTLTMVRYEPRLFDEVCDWLVTNAKWIDNQRLRGILKNKSTVTKRLMSAVASLVIHEAGTYKRKWQPLGKLAAQTTNDAAESLFITKAGDVHPKPREESEIFKRYGFIRGPVRLRKMSKPVFVNGRSNIRFLLRALFGIGSRSECILFLLTHESGHPSETAKAIGISVRAVQDTLIDLSMSGLVITIPHGRRKIQYKLSSDNKWWSFLTYNHIMKPIWLDWISLYSALEGVWEGLLEAEKTKSDYLRSSKLREAMETISLEFTKSNLGFPLVLDKNIRPERYEEAFQDFIIQVLGAKSGSTSR